MFSVILCLYVCFLLRWTCEGSGEHLSAAEPWPPFSSNWELELVDRVSAGSDRHSPIGVTAAKASVTSCWLYNFPSTQFNFQSKLLHQWNWSIWKLLPIPVHTDPDVVVQELRDDRQDRCGAVCPAPQDFTETKKRLTYLIFSLNINTHTPQFEDNIWSHLFVADDCVCTWAQ